MKKLTHYLSQLQFRDNPEFTQATIRMAIWMLVTTLISIQFSGTMDPSTRHDYIIFMIVFLIVALGILITTIFVPRSKIRPYLTAPFDLGSVSLTMIISQSDPFNAYFLLYPWIFVGYGARYGRGPLFAATFVSIVGFLYVLWLNHSWSNDPFSSSIYTMFLFMLPLYVNTMITKLMDARKTAEKASKEKSEFLAAMSHEIRTPMSGIIGITSLLENTRLNPVQQEYVGALQQSSTALHTLINDILDVSKIEAGKYQLHVRKFDLHHIIHGVAQMFTPTANMKNLELINFIQPNVPSHVVGDPDRLRQILLNLVSNATKFTNEGEISIQTTIVANKKDEKIRIRIEVSDTGAGIPNEQLEKIFEPFYQGKNFNPHYHTGTGLGTTISYQLVTLMNGEIGACSNVGNGSVFWIEIPYYEYSTAAPIQPLQHLNIREILILDKNKTSSLTTEFYLHALQLNCTQIPDEYKLEKVLAEKLLVQKISPPKSILVILCDSQNNSNHAVLANRLHKKYSKQINLLHITYMDKVYDMEGSKNNPFQAQLIRPIFFTQLHDCLENLYSIKNHITKKPTSGTVKKLTPVTNNKKYNILVAEDSDINARVICTFLQQAGHYTDRVVSGKQAISALHNKKYDLVFMDMCMPNKDGVDATREWRKVELKKHSLYTPIVALTANATVEDKRLCLNVGMNEFLSKPVNKNKLLNVMYRIINESQQKKSKQ